MKKNHTPRKGFLPLFVFTQVAELAASVAQVSGEEAFSHLAMLWFGPLDDVFFGLLGIQGVLYLLDPDAEMLKDGKDQSWPNFWRYLSAGRGAATTFATGFVRGTERVFKVLPLLLLVALILNLVLPGSLMQGLLLSLFRQLGYLVPIAALVVGACRALRLVRDSGVFTRSLGLAALSLLATAAYQGRWENHLYHIFANLENVHAWMTCLAWAATALVVNDSHQRLEVSEP